MSTKHLEAGSVAFFLCPFFQLCLGAEDWLQTINYIGATGIGNIWKHEPSSKMTSSYFIIFHHISVLSCHPKLANTSKTSWGEMQPLPPALAFPAHVSCHGKTFSQKLLLPLTQKPHHNVRLQAHVIIIIIASLRTKHKRLEVIGSMHNSIEFHDNQVKTSNIVPLNVLETGYWSIHVLQ